MLRKILLGAFLLAGACGSDDGGGPVTENGIELTAWVHDLVANPVGESADPDTVDDKMIIPTEDPAAFDTYFAQ